MQQNSLQHSLGEIEQHLKEIDRRLERLERNGVSGAGLSSRTWGYLVALMTAVGVIATAVSAVIVKQLP